MDNNILKRIMNSELIDELYSNNLFTIKSIAKHLDIWDSLTSDEKNQLEKITTADSLINGHKDEYLSLFHHHLENACSDQIFCSFIF